MAGSQCPLCPATRHRHGRHFATGVKGDPVEWCEACRERYCVKHITIVEGRWYCVKDAKKVIDAGAS